MLYLLDAAATKSAQDAATFCCNMSDLFSLVGLFVTIFKIIIPILLIVFGIMDVGKSVTAGKDDEIKKNLKSFAFRVAAAIMVFFIPNIVGMVMSMLANATSNQQSAAGWKCCEYRLGLGGSETECSTNLTN